MALRGRGQIGYEYMTMLGISLLIVSIFVVVAFNLSTNERTTREAEISVSIIAGAAESVHAQGEGAKQTVTVPFPEFSNLDESTISGRILNLKVTTSDGLVHDVTHAFPFNVTGSFPEDTGRQPMAVEALSSGEVSITPA